mmetsp:Transcript_47729/g.54968  ORF Transcript_47729/g.54968 Transcript_47729/m.54968 type:complete len:509 (+) Transcript_47729:39-1565(+)
MGVLAFLLCVIVVFSTQSRAMETFGTKEVPSTMWYSGYNMTYTDVTLDHFRFQNNATFPLRYLYNLDAVEVDSEQPTPVIVLMGCENAAPGFWESAGFVTTTLRERFNAAVLGIEHRYFGTSLPFGKNSFTEENIAYLTIDQALADHVEVIQMFKEKYGFQDSPVVTFGASYCGMLSVYMRMRYPWLVEGAIGAAAPYRGFVGSTSNPFAYSQALTQDYSNYAPQCESILRNGFQTLRSFFDSSEEEFTELSEQLNLCKPVLSAPEVGDLYAWFESAILSLALFDYPYRTLVPANPLNVACDRAISAVTSTSSPANGRFLDDNTFQNNINALKPMLDAVNVFYNRTETNTCNNIYSLDEFGGLDSLAWAYISGTTFIMETGSNGVTDMFWDAPLNLELRSQYLEKKFGFPVINRPESLVNSFGGRNYKHDLLQYSNIIFSNGSIDPTHVLSITENISDTIIGFKMEGAAHGLDIYLPNPLDPESVVRGRQVEIANIYKWINEFYERQE